MKAACDLVHNATSPDLSTPKIRLPEKSSDEALSFVDFIRAARVKASPRGDLIALYRTLINANAFPTITSWPELVRFMRGRQSRPDAIDAARALWKEYQKSAGGAEGLPVTAVPPAQPGSISHA